MHKECFLKDRPRSVGTLDSQLTLTVVNYLEALRDLKIEALLSKTSGWGPLGDVLYAAVTAALLLSVEGAAAAVLADIAAERTALEIGTETVAAEAVSSVASVVRTTISTARGSLSSVFAGLPYEAKQKVEFVTHLQNQAAPLFKSIRQNIVRGTDADVLAGIRALDPEVNTVQRFREQFELSFARFQELRLDEIGASSRRDIRYGGTRETVWLHANGQYRLAIVVFHETGIERKSMTKYENKSYFVSWVDPEFQDAAIGAQAKGIGAVKEIDVSMPQLYGFEDPTLEVESWAHRQYAKRAQP